jgi:hypothetical protein
MHKRILPGAGEWPDSNPEVLQNSQAHYMSYLAWRGLSEVKMCRRAHFLVV